MGDQEKGRSAKKLKSLMDVPYLARLKVQVLNFNMNLISSLWRIPRPRYPFGGKLGRSGKGRSHKKLKSLIEVLYVVQLKVHVLSFNMNNVFSP